jgi:prepilin-type N-terminal cleavage/methylation domain-containing protein
VISTTDTRRSGFNLIETLVASVILSGAVLTLGAISSRGLTSTRLNRHHEVAASVLDKQLTLIDAMGIDTFIDLGVSEGVIEELEPGYTWAVSTEYEGIDNVYLVTVTVRWMEANRPHEVSAQTRLNGVSTVMPQATEER